MNVTPFLGSISASQPSEAQGNDALALISANPLGSVDGIAKTLNFDADSLLNLSPSDEDSEGESDAVALLPLLNDDATVALTGDKKQNLLTHLLHAAQEVPSVPMLHRAEPGRLNIQVNIPTNEAPLALDAQPKSVASVAQPLAAPIQVTVDKPMPVKPQFFAQALLKSASAASDGSGTEQNSIVSTVVKSLAETGETVRASLNPSVGVQEAPKTIEREGQFSWSPIKLRGSKAQMTEQLHSVLRERLQIQADNKVQQATIRLDPPGLGKIDISLHIDAGKLNVQIHAGQSDVYRSLQQMSNELRQHLTEQNFVQVNVQVSSDGSHQGRERQKNTFADETISTAREIDAPQRVDRDDDSILTTV